MNHKPMQLGILGLITVGIFAWHISTVTPAYRIFPDNDVKRGDQIKSEKDSLDDIFPKDLADSLYLLELKQGIIVDEVRANTKDMEPNWSGLLVSISAMLGALYGGISLLDKKSHAKIFEILKDMSVSVKVVEDISIKKDFEESLRTVARNYMHYHKGEIPEKLQALICSQAERLIEVSQQIMSENYTPEIYEFTCVKIDEQSRIGWIQVEELFNKKFLDIYKVGQESAVTKFKAGLLRIVSDAEFNGKYARYRRVAEEFLDDLIMTTIREYRNYKV